MRIQGGAQPPQGFVIPPPPPAPSPTVAKGTATITSAATTTVVAHGLAYTPDISDIAVEPTNFMGAATKYRVTAPTATDFTIEVNAAPGGVDTATFAWRITRV